ncbi:MAG: zf-HC2 domain-containing protein [Actinomycetota bacterium]|nr:zf-HC2 domain-containing protein [Actinomycetota bacterium]
MIANVEDLSCQELVELVTDYLEGALSEADHARFEAHLAVCGNCQEYLDQIRTTMELLGRVTPETITVDAQRTLLQAFRDWKAVKED